MTASGEEILQVKDLYTSFISRHGIVQAVNGVSFSLKAGEVMAIVGESGSGKSVSCLSVMRLHQPHTSQISGEVYLSGENLMQKTEREMQRIRGNKISMIFQEPMTSLNPVYTIGKQLMEPLRMHRKFSKQKAYEASLEILRQVGIYPPQQRMSEFPHQLSGGMRQRVMIAMSLCCNPEVLIADEPTTALDVTIQAQIMDLMRQLTEQFRTAIILITHDLGLARELARRVMVMYNGVVVEEGELKAMFKDPRHPYTEGLLNSIPRLDQKLQRLSIIPGNVPGPFAELKGCRFHPRCRYRRPLCEEEEPVLTEAGKDRRVACHYPLGYFEADMAGGEVKQ